MSDRNMAAMPPCVHSPAGERTANMRENLDDAGPAPASSLIYEHLPILALTTMGRAADLAVAMQRDGWQAADEFLLNLVDEEVGRRGMHDILNGRCHQFTPPEGWTFGQVVGELSRQIRVTVSAALALREESAGRPLGPVREISQGLVYGLAIAPESALAHARVWLSSKNVGELHAMTEMCTGLRLAYRAAKFQQPFDSGDFLPKLSERICARGTR